MNATNAVKEMRAQIRALTPDQRNAFLAAFLGWTLDAFDFFLMVFVLDDIARTFRVSHEKITVAITLTLAFRPLGALLFGIAGDRFGRRIPLMVDVIFYSLMEFLTGFAPTLTAFFVLRALFGVAMGGEWGLGASLAMETIPPRTRGLLSGLLQEGYACGYLLAALVYPLVAPHFGWRAMFMVGVLPALLSLFIRSKVKESPAWRPPHKAKANSAGFATAVEGKAEPTLGASIMRNLGLFLYLILLMTAFNFFSHGSQDLYPTFLKTQRGFQPTTVSTIAVVYNVGALSGGIFFGALSQTIGRRRAIVIAALFALPLIPLWSFSQSAVLLAVGAFAIQFMIQGAWGVVPAHLTELAPPRLRGTFTGFAYQIGNFIASSNAVLQAHMAESRRDGANHKDYATALASVIAVAALAVAGTTALGREARDVSLGNDALPPLEKRNE